MSLRSNPGRQRRQSVPASEAPQQRNSSPTRNRVGDYYDDGSDEETGKGHKNEDQMYNGACSLGRFFLNPCLCIALSCQMICCRTSRQQEGSVQSRARKRQPTHPHQRRRLLLRGFLLLCVIVSIVFWSRPQNHARHSLRHQSDASLDSMPILIKLFDFSNVNDIGGWHYHGLERFYSSLEPLEQPNTLRDTGGLLIPSLRYAPTFRRSIAPDDDIRYQQYKKMEILKMDQLYLRSYYDHPEESLSLKCQRPSFANLYFPSCNEFHEIDLLRDYDPHAIDPWQDLSYFDSYIFSNGYYRDAWMLKNTETNATKSDTVLKTLRIEHDFSIKQFYQVQKDALVMERLTSSPRILNMYGHCSMSIMVQPIPFEVEEYIVPGDGMARQSDLDALDDVESKNDFSVQEKLEMALQMAESIADLHGYHEGMMIHNDIQLCQWLRNENDKLIFGDFNRAESPGWRDDEQRYCTYKNGYVYGNYRSPEEMRDDPLDEKIDIYSFGNNLYALLTGLWVFYENDDDKVVQQKVKGGERAFIDDRWRNRSYGEGKLVELMERCWNEHPKDRVDIFEAVRYLREAVKENKRRNG